MVLLYRGFSLCSNSDSFATLAAIRRASSHCVTGLLTFIVPRSTSLSSLASLAIYVVAFINKKRLCLMGMITRTGGTERA